MQKMAIVIQARMSSERLPGKVLMSVNGKPLLSFLIERVAKGIPDFPLIVATSVEKSDDPVVQFCRDMGVRCHRGSLNDVAVRFRDIVISERLSGFVRLNGDSPLLDPTVIQTALQVFAKKSPDLVTNTKQRSFPVGQSVEVLDGKSYVASYEKFHSSDHYEHVTKYYYDHSEDFNIVNFMNTVDMQKETLSVDTQEDFDVFVQLVSSLTKPHWQYGWRELLDMKREIEGR